MNLTKISINGFWSSRLPAICLGLIPLVFLGLFYFYPLTGIFKKSFFEQGGDSLAGLARILTSPRMMRIMWFTVWQAGLSTFITLILALPCAYVMARFRFPGKQMLMTLATIPFVLPTIVVAAAFNALAGKNGLIGFLNLNHSVYLILAAHVFFNFSVVVRITATYWSYIGKEIREAAMLLGATPLKVFTKVTLPLLQPALAGSAMLVFMFCFSSFGVVLILGGPGYATIEVEIYRQAAHLFNLPVAAVLSLIQILFTFVLMWFYTALQREAAALTPEAESRDLQKAETLIQKMMIVACAAFILFFCGLPMAALVVKSFWFNGGPSLIFYREIFVNTTDSLFYVSPGTAVSNSLFFAGATLGLALVVGVTAAGLIRSSRGRAGAFLEPLFMLPLSTSAVTLGFGIIITLDKPPLNLRTSAILVPVAHTLVAFPFVVRATLPALKAIPSSLKEAAAMLGASRIRTWLLVDLPIIARALAAGAIFAFTMSLGEFGATLFVSRPEFSTMPVAIYRFLGQPGLMNHGQAMAISSLLMAVTAAGFLLIEKVRSLSREGF